MASAFDDIAPAGFGWTPTLSDTADQPMETRCILVGVAGNIRCEMYDPTTQKRTAITLACQAGYNPIKTWRIYSTSTTATGITCLA